MHGTIPGVPCISATLVHHTPHDTESTKEPHTEGTDMTLTLTVTDTLTNTRELHTDSKSTTHAQNDNSYSDLHWTQKDKLHHLRTLGTE